MKKILPLFSLLLLFVVQIAQSQTRYSVSAFPSVSVTSNVVYGSAVPFGSTTPINLLMDVYQPTGDILMNRPLIILIHSGSFLPRPVISAQNLPFSWGDKTDSAMVELCTQFARRGWVAVSMTHRLGWNPASTEEEIRASTIIQAVYRGTQDLRTCIRFFKQDRAGTNVYRIDTTRITVGGSSSGGYLAVNGFALDKASEVTSLSKFQFSGTVAGTPVAGSPFINQTNSAGATAAWPFLGGFNDGANQGFTNNYQLALNMGGAVGDTTWIEPSDIPVISFHGVADPTTPYATAIVLTAGTNQPIVEVSGSRDIQARSRRLGNLPAGMSGTNDAPLAGPDVGLKPWFGAANGFEPFNWYSANPNNTTPSMALNPTANKTRALLYIDTVMRYFIPRVVRLLNLDTTAVTLGFADESALEGFVSLYPNPASNILNLSVEATDLRIQAFRMFDMLGKEAIRVNRVSEQFLSVPVADLPKGLYILRIETDRGMVSKKVLLD
jgi:hypothetical protein